MKVEFKLLSLLKPISLCLPNRQKPIISSISVQYEIQYLLLKTSYMLRLWPLYSPYTTVVLNTFVRPESAGRESATKLEGSLDALSDNWWACYWCCYKGLANYNLVIVMINNGFCVLFYIRLRSTFVCDIKDNKYSFILKALSGLFFRENLINQLSLSIFNTELRLLISLSAKLFWWLKFHKWDNNIKVVPHIYYILGDWGIIFDKFVKIIFFNSLLHLSRRKRF